MKIPACTHVVALSGGKDSTAMALRLKEFNPSTSYRYICTPTGRELPEMFEHWKKLGQILGHFIEPIMHPLGLTGMIDHYNALPNYRMRWCTRELKIEPYERWLRKSRVVRWTSRRRGRQRRWRLLQSSRRGISISTA